MFKSKLAFLLMYLIISEGLVFMAGPSWLLAEGYIKKVQYFKSYVWDGKAKTYHFRGLISKENISHFKNYYELFLGEKNRYLYAKRYVAGKVQARFHYTKNNEISHYFFYKNTIKTKSLFYRKPGVTLKEFDYDPFTGQILKKVFYRLDGKTLLKVEIYDHGYLRVSRIYRSNGKLKSETEYFEGRKTTYDKNGRKVKVIRFRPKKIR